MGSVRDSWDMKYEYSDGGRSGAGFTERNDCVVRALAISLGIPYPEAHSRAKAFGRRKGCRMKWPNFRAMMALDFEIKPELSCMSLQRALEQMQSGRFVVAVSGHVFAVVNGTVCDSWEQKPGRRVNMVYVPKNTPTSQLSR